MKSLLCAVGLCALQVVLLLAGPAGAVEAAAQVDRTGQVLVELVDGSRIVGTPRERAVRLMSILGAMDIPMGYLRRLAIGADQETAVADLDRGDRISGTLMALVWDGAGNIPGVSDANRKITIFLDGQSNSQIGGSPKDESLLFRRKGLVRLTFPGSNPAAALPSLGLDNLRVWKVARADFSDRNEE